MDKQKISTDRGTLSGSDGYIQKHGVSVQEIDDEIIYVGDTPHHKSDLFIEENRITSKVFGWEVTW